MNTLTEEKSNDSKNKQLNKVQTDYKFLHKWSHSMKALTVFGNFKNYPKYYVYLGF